MSVLSAYDALVAAGELKPDPEQRAAAERLNALQAELEAVPPRGSLLWRLTGRKPEAPRGVYLWGAVGRGKSAWGDWPAAVWAFGRYYWHCRCWRVCP